MGKNKLQRFAENETFENLYQHSNYDIRNSIFPLKGKWQKQHFHNQNPIILEVGCGRGEYTVALAQRFPDCNFIGIDRKGARIWRGCKDALTQQLHNAAFIRTKIEDIEFFFGTEEISEIWITFPDPQPRKSRRRLISPNFVEKYKNFLKPDGIIHLKTDSRLLYEYTLETAQTESWIVLKNIEDVYNQTENPLLKDIQTFYEKKWLAEASLISYLKIRIPQPSIIL